MQTKEDQQFRLNPQVLVMVAVALFALALPVAMGVYALQLYTREASPPPDSDVGMEPLRQVLEDIAIEHFPAATLDPDRIPLEVTVTDPGNEQARIMELARTFEATALPSEGEGGSTKVLVSIARDRTEEFIQRCRGSEEPVQLPEDQVRFWVEIVIAEQKTP
jgi:hypothetical protein